MKPGLILTESPDEKWREKWNKLTQADRKRMTVPELIEAMGPLHVSHPKYQPRDIPLIPMPNLAGHQPVISRTEYGVLAQWRALLYWAMQ